MTFEEDEKTVKIDTRGLQIESSRKPSNSGGTVRLTTRRIVPPSVKMCHTNLQAITPQILEQYQKRLDEKRICKCRHHLTIHKNGKCQVCQERCPGYRERDEDDIATSDNMEDASTRELIEELRKKK